MSDKQPDIGDLWVKMESLRNDLKAMHNWTINAQGRRNWLGMVLLLAGVAGCVLSVLAIPQALSGFVVLSGAGFVLMFN